eukprot:315554-Chlamydomonas_euryale.AAC.5
MPLLPLPNQVAPSAEPPPSEPPEDADDRPRASGSAHARGRSRGQALVRARRILLEAHSGRSGAAQVWAAVHTTASAHLAAPPWRGTSLPRAFVSAAVTAALDRARATVAASPATGFPARRFAFRGIRVPGQISLRSWCLEQAAATATDQQSALRPQSTSEAASTWLAESKCEGQIARPSGSHARCASVWPAMHACPCMSGACHAAGCPHHLWVTQRMMAAMHEAHEAHGACMGRMRCMVHAWSA